MRTLVNLGQLARLTLALGLLACAGCGSIGDTTSVGVDTVGASPTPQPSSANESTTSSNVGSTTAGNGGTGGTATAGNTNITSGTGASTTGGITTAGDTNSNQGTTTGGATSVGTTTSSSGATTQGTAPTSSPTPSTCAETWTNYAQNFFNTRCTSCHSSMSNYQVVVSGAYSIQLYISNRSMPRGSTLSTSDYNKILDWFACTPATPQ